MKKLFSVLIALTMMASLLTTAVFAAQTDPGQASELGQLKVCKVARSGVPEGKLFNFRVNGESYSVPAGPPDDGYCVLAGQYPIDTQVTIEEIIPSGYYVSRIEVEPDRAVSRDTAQGIVTVEIGDGVTEVTYTNKVIGPPTPTRTPTSVHTSTPRPTRTPPSCAPNCTPTPTRVPTGRMQICKEADGAGVTGYFTFEFADRSRTVPVGACAGLVTVDAGTLTITEEAQAGYAVSDIYTIPADRLISKDLSGGKATVRIVEGTTSSQTIVVFRNRSITSVTSTATPTPTRTPPGGVTPTFTPTFTSTPTGSVTPVCPPITVFADFSHLELGDSVEGLGAVAPYLDIRSTVGEAVKIEEAEEPFQYRAGDPPIVNGGIGVNGGFGDTQTQQAGQAHRYEFTFTGISVSEFSLRMLDHGDLNPSLNTDHHFVMTAFNANNDPIATHELDYTTDAELLPDNSPEWGNLQITGDALRATPGQPGNWTWQVAGDGIVKVILEFGAGHDPNVAFDSLSYTTEVCPVCQPFNSAAFSQIPAGTAVEGFGVLAPYFSINARGTAVKVEEAEEPFQYRAGDPPIVNGGIGANGGFGDTQTQQARQAHRYTFTFALGISVSEFSLRMLDHGDLNPTLNTDHHIVMTAFDANNNLVATHELDYTTDAELLPDNSPEWGNLQITGDALRATPGQPGNWTWQVAGDGIVKVVLEFGAAYDPNVAFDSISYTCP